jgi:Uma2 family endonuclease
MTTKTQLLTIADWDAMPADDGNRYEIIEGELFVSCSPGLTHQIVLARLIFQLSSYERANPIGTVVPGPGLILSNVSGVIPDLVFFRNEQRDTIVTNDRLTGPPALVIEIVSPGSANIKRDRVAKLRLYAKHGVSEYWIVDPQHLTIERYVDDGSSLALFETLREEDNLVTGTLPGFSCPVSDIFRRQL